MSLRDFIRATSKEFQDANSVKATTSEQQPATTVEPGTAVVTSSAADVEKSASSEEVSLFVRFVYYAHCPR